MNVWDSLGAPRACKGLVLSFSVQNVIESNSCSAWFEERIAAKIQARIQHGRVEVQIPAEWEGHLVELTPMTPDDPLPDLEERLMALHALGPMEFEPGQEESIADTLAQLNDAGKAAMQAMATRKP